MSATRELVGRYAFDMALMKDWLVRRLRLDVLSARRFWLTGVRRFLWGLPAPRRPPDE